MRFAAMLLFALAGGMVFSGCDGGKGDSSAEARHWLKLEIERPEPEETEEPPVEESIGEVGDELLTNTYIVPPSFLKSAPSAEPPEDPFAADGVAPKKMNAQEVLEAFGVTFGPGARASYSKKDALLRVTQTLEQMDLVEAIIESRIGTSPGDWSTITIRFEFYELPATQAVELERSASEHFEHTPELNAVLDLVKEGRANLVTTANLLCRSGQRTEYRDGIERPLFGNLETDEAGEDSVIRKQIPREFVGTVIEADPVLGPDSRTLDLHYEIKHHIPVPEDSPNSDGAGRVLTWEMNSTETVLSGTVKLLGSWQASEAGDSPRSRIVFLKAVAVADLLREQQ